MHFDRGPGRHDGQELDEVLLRRVVLQETASCDVLRELVQNEYDATGTAIAVEFGADSLTVTGNGTRIDGRPTVEPEKGQALTDMKLPAILDDRLDVEALKNSQHVVCWLLRE